MFSALERSTASVPKTTQNACCTPVSWETSTARPSATAPLTLFCSQSECGSTWDPARSCAVESRSASPMGRRPSTWSSQLRRSAAADSATLPAICMTTKLSSCARKPGSSAEITASPLVVSGTLMVAPRSSSASRSRSSASATCSGSRLCLGMSSRSAQRSSTTAAACFTAHARRSTVIPGGGLARVSTTIPLSHLSSSTSRTTARAAVLRPVGR